MLKKARNGQKGGQVFTFYNKIIGRVQSRQTTWFVCNSFNFQRSIFKLSSEEFSCFETITKAQEPKKQVHVGLKIATRVVGGRRAEIMGASFKNLWRNQNVIKKERLFQKSDEQVWKLISSVWLLFDKTSLDQDHCHHPQWQPTKFKLFWRWWPRV